jgi:Bacterial Ig domain
MKIKRSLVLLAVLATRNFSHNRTRSIEIPMLRGVIAVSVLVFSHCPVYAQCAVEPWSIPYLGSNTSTTMLAGSGQVCQIDPGVGGTSVLTSVAISAAPANGSVSVNGDAVLYQSQSGFTGQDSFTFTLSGSGPGGSGTSSIQVSVTVK